MSWRIEVKPSAEKQYLRLDKPTRRRIKPLLHPRVRPLTGRLKGDCRVRIGGWRILLTPDPELMRLFVYAVLPRGTPTEELSSGGMER